MTDNERKLISLMLVIVLSEPGDLDLRRRSLAEIEGLTPHLDRRQDGSVGLLIQVAPDLIEAFRESDYLRFKASLRYVQLALLNVFAERLQPKPEGA